MSKEAYYFSHDANARQDDKILELRAEFGWEGYGLFWAIIETLRDCSNYTYPISAKAGLALSLSIPKPQLEKLLEFCFEIKLLINHNGVFYSESLMRRMEEVDAKRKKRAEAGRLGGLAKAEAQQNPSNAIAMPEQNPSNDLANPSKESKEKETKVKKKKVKKIKEEETDLEAAPPPPKTSKPEDFLKAGKKDLETKPLNSKPAPQTEPPVDNYHKLFLDAYIRFYYDRVSIEPKITTAGAVAAADLRKFLTKQSNDQTEEGALKALEYVFKKWDTLEPFLQNQVELTQINKNINNILIQIKNGYKTNKGNANGGGADLATIHAMVDASFGKSN